jgi:signal transduction histidine kinase
VSSLTTERSGDPSPQLQWPASSAEEILVTLAHEWRGRLHALVLNTELMRMALHSGSELPRVELLDRLAHQTRALRSMQQLMDQLLEARQPQPVRETSKDVLDLRALVIDVLSCEEDALRSAQCSCSLVAPAPVPGQWDASQLRVAISNLVSNAIKYGAGQPVEVSVGLREEHAYVCVADHGSGVKPEDRDRIFERFERAASNLSVSGYGLGLWLVRNIARAHGGDVALRSVPGHGAAFTLSLPCLR